MRFFSALSIASLLLIACGPPTENEPDAWDPSVEVACELGIVDSTGTFVPLSQTTSLELILGFQGFLFVVIHARIDAAPDGLADALTSIEVDLGSPMGGGQRGVGLKAASGGKAITDEINVFLDSSSTSEYVDRDATVSLRLVTANWFCVASATGHLVDEDDCIHTGEEPVCPDAGL